MRALVYGGPRTLNLQERERPVCPKNGMLLKVESCGLCGSDVRVYHSSLPKGKIPRVIGHEIAGIVEEIDSTVKNFSKGDRVSVNPLLYCGKCPYCKKGLYYCCNNIKVMGREVTGGFAEYIALSQEFLEGGNISLISNNLSFEEAAVIEPLSSCLNAQERAKVGMGHTVLVIGAGPIGAFHCEIARARGATKILLHDILEKRLRLVERINSDMMTIYSDKDNLSSEVFNKTNGEGVDVTIIACSSSEAQRQALELTKKNGVVVFFGGLPDEHSEVNLDVNLIHYRNLKIQGTFSFSPQHYKLALELISMHRIEVSKYISHVFSFAETEEAIDLVSRGEALKVILKPAKNSS